MASPLLLPIVLEPMSWKWEGLVASIEHGHGLGPLTPLTPFGRGGSLRYLSGKLHAQLWGLHTSHQPPSWGAASFSDQHPKEGIAGMEPP